jgi:DNA helicase HerA-like ATPase
LSLGHYTLDEDAEAFLNGNRFFQRHAIVVGSTGSGKSWTTARVLEQVGQLQHANAIVFDIHGEYRTLCGDGIRHLRVAGPGDQGKGTGTTDGVLFMPYWLLSYEALISMFVDRSDQNAPNQAMLMSRSIVNAKRAFLEAGNHKDVLDNFTIDSPVPFPIDTVLKELNDLNTEMVAGSTGRDKQGDFYGKLSRLIARLENKLSDRRLGFLFQAGGSNLQFEWLEDLAVRLMGGTAEQPDKTGGVKVIDFSEVPSDILPLIVSLIARIAFSVQQWTVPSKRHPVALFCDEAHLYVPEREQGDAANQVSIDTFERIAKEGRKYGVGLVVISQRPSEVNRTVLSQCNNLIAMRLTNAEDQSVVRRLLPDSLGGFSDLLPVLDTGEALVVGDASLLPSRIRVSEPVCKPDSGTVDFWDKWSVAVLTNGVVEAVQSWRKQSMAN